MELTYVTSTPAIAGPAMVAAKLSELRRVFAASRCSSGSSSASTVYMPRAPPRVQQRRDREQRDVQRRRQQPGEPGERYGAEEHAAHHVVGEQQPPGRYPAQTATEHQRADHPR
jgi:hypothetical protein